MLIGYGIGGRPDFWIGPNRTGTGFRESHLAFPAPSRAAVRDFCAAAVGTGAEVLYEPELWPEYHASYYAGFVRDPDATTSRPSAPPGRLISGACRPGARPPDQLAEAAIRSRDGPGSSASARSRSNTAV
jgi:hypothetical protein